MAEGDRLLRMKNSVFAGLVADMAQVNDDTDSVHLIHDFTSEIREATVAALPATTTNPVMGIVGQLNDTDTQFLEQTQVAYLVFNAGSVLPAEYNSNFPRPSRVRCRRWYKPG